MTARLPASATLRPTVLRALLAAGLIVAPALALAQDEEHAAEERAGAAEALPAITVSEVRPLRLTDRVIASGLVEAVEEVSVQPLIEGQPIDELLADVGDTVAEGQALARLSTSTLELELSQLAANRATALAQIAQAEATLLQATTNTEEAERVAARDQELAAAGTVPRAQADQTQAAAVASRASVGVAEQGVASAQAQMELVEAQIENAQLRLSRAEVKAPVGGLVVARNAQVGAIASASGGPMFTIVRDNAMELRADVSEQDLLRMEQGQRAILTVAEGAEPLSGTVRLVEPSIDPQTRLGTARVEIDDPGRVVKGMFLTAEVVVSEEETLAVPVTAVGSGAEGHTVMRVLEGVVERVPVVVGIRDGGSIGIREGLSGGDLVVTKAAAFVRDGDRINPVVAEVETASAAAPAAEVQPAPAGEASLTAEPVEAAQAPEATAEAADPQPAPADEARTTEPSAAEPVEVAEAVTTAASGDAAPAETSAADEGATVAQGPGAVPVAPEAPPVRPVSLSAAAADPNTASAASAEGEPAP